LKSFGEAPDLALNLADPVDRARYGQDGITFIQECRALRKRGARIVVDEVQMAPAVVDAVQVLYDENPRRFKFYLTGSSARRLRQHGSNLLPGRAFLYRMHPLTLLESPAREGRVREGAEELFPLSLEGDGRKLFPERGLSDRLLYGDLPGIVTAPARNRAALLQAYTAIYLEEEVRREASLRDISRFAKFLALAAVESGKILNYAKISRQVGVSEPTIKTYYQILEDMFVGFSIPAFSGSDRAALVSTPRFFLFDLGVRNAAAHLPFDAGTVAAGQGALLEHWVGLELWRRTQYAKEGRLSYYRTRGGAEVDYILELRKETIPVEVKWTEAPHVSDAKTLLTFIDQNKRATRGFIVCRCPRPMRLAQNVLAIPWWMI
jgi:predicted AAA+ superfamily ATPase